MKDNIRLNIKEIKREDWPGKKEEKEENQLHLKINKAKNKITNKRNNKLKKKKP